MTAERPTRTATLRFNLDASEGQSAARRALNADGAYSALYDIHDEIFRPAFKHGYQDMRIQCLVDKIDKGLGENGATALIELLSEKYREILQENGIDFERDWA